MKRKLTWQLIWLAPAIFVVSLFFGWTEAETTRRSLSPAGGMDPLFADFFVVLADAALCFVSLSAFIVSCVLACIQPTRFAGVFILVCSLSYLGGWQSRDAIFGDPRREAFTKLGERMMPLVNAIDAYHHDHDAYPKKLDVLVPAYLDKLPATGMGNHPDYTYDLGPTHGGNPWVLDIPVGSGMNFDQFYYFPLQNYPGPPYERIGKWAYYHE